MKGIQIHKLKKKDQALLQGFIDSLGASADTFRYFDKRTIDVVDLHHITLLILDQDKPVAYGHLEPENGIDWLGIAVIESSRGRGFGREMMKALIGEAENLKLKEIRLSVDASNTAAIALYRSMGFELLEVRDDIRFYTFNPNRETSEDKT